MITDFKSRKTVLLTGGIASGKTFVSDYLASKGANIIDTDQISRELTNPLSKLSEGPLDEIRNVFGDDLILPDGGLNRTKMREIIFNDSEAKKALEMILHQRIYQHVLEQINSIKKSPYDVVVVPLLHEKSPYLSLADTVLVIEVPYELQLQRLMSRDNIDKNLADKIIQSQISRLDRRQLADNILINENPKFIKRQLDKLHDHYSQQS